MVGFILFIVPGIIWAVQYNFSLYTCLVEGKKGWSALRRSKEIVKNYWWTTARRLVFWGIIAMLSSLIASLPLIGLVGNFLLPFVLTPLVIIYFYAVYSNIIDLKQKGQEAEKLRRRDKAVTVLLTLVPLVLLILVSLIGFLFDQGDYKAQLEMKQKGLSGDELMEMWDDRVKMPDEI